MSPSHTVLPRAHCSSRLTAGREHTRERPSDRRVQHARAGRGAGQSERKLRVGEERGGQRAGLYLWGGRRGGDSARGASPRGGGALHGCGRAAPGCGKTNGTGARGGKARTELLGAASKFGERNEASSSVRAALRAGFRRAPGTSIAGSTAIDADGARSAAGASARARPASHIVR